MRKISAKFGKHIIQIKRGVCFYGQTTQSITIEILPDTKLIKIQTFPYAVLMFISYPMNL